MTTPPLAVGTIAIVGRRAALLVPQDRLFAPMAELRTALTSDDPIDSFLALVSRTGLREVPPFVCAVRETNLVRLLVRGSAGACVCSADGFEVKLTAGRIATWVERVVDAPSEILLFADVADTAGTTLSLLWDDLATSTPLPTPQPTVVAVDEAGSPAQAYRSSTVVQAGEAGPIRGREASELAEHANLDPVSTAWSSLDDPAELDIDLAHLLERTSHRDVEAAAVRDVDDDAPNAVASSPPERVQPVRLGAGAGPRELPTMQIGPALDGAEGVAEVAPRSGEHQGLIQTPRPESQTSAGRPPVSATVDHRDHGDHDGNTISVAKLRASVVESAASPGRPEVQAIVCANGHANPPYADRCRSCNTAIADRRVRMQLRPSLGRLRFDDGLVVDLDRPLLVGRRPRPPESDAGAETPALIAIPDPEMLLSRVHLEVDLDGWQVLVVDCHSVNCTFVEAPGQPVRQLRPEEPCLIGPGTRVDLAHVAAFVYEVPGA